MGLFGGFRNWRENRRLRRIEKLTAKAAGLDPNQTHDLLILHDRGFVRARATGQSITQIYGEVENLIDKSLRVVIKPGTYFVARGNHQNMVTREEYTVTLSPCSTKSVSIDASCINAGLPIPQKQARFYGVRRVSDKVARFLEASSGADAMTVQTGVWALTDNYTGEQVKRHLQVRDRYGNTRQAVSDENVREARRILRDLGISNRL